MVMHCCAFSTVLRHKKERGGNFKYSIVQPSQCSVSEVGFSGRGGGGRLNGLAVKAVGARQYFRVLVWVFML